MCLYFCAMLLYFLRNVDDWENYMNIWVSGAVLHWVGECRVPGQWIKEGADSLRKKYMLINLYYFLFRYNLNKYKKLRMTFYCKINFYSQNDCKIKSQWLCRQRLHNLGDSAPTYNHLIIKIMNLKPCLHLLLCGDQVSIDALNQLYSSDMMNNV